MLEYKQYKTLSTFQKLLVQNNFTCVVGKKLNAGHVLSAVKVCVYTDISTHMYTLNKTSLKKKKRLLELEVLSNQF